MSTPFQPYAGLPGGLPDLTDFCVALPITGELCVPIVGGATLCAHTGLELGDPGDLTRGLLAQINGALTPLQPFFNTIDVIQAIVDCVQAIPDAIGPPPDPSAIAACIPGLVEKLNKLLQLLPPVSVPAMIRAILDVVIFALIALRADLQRFILEQNAILAAGTRAAELGNVELQLMVDCAQSNLDALLVNRNASLAPLNRLLGLLNLLLELAGLPCIAALGTEISAADQAVLDALDAAIQALEAVKAGIPALDFQLDPIPGPNDPC